MKNNCEFVSTHQRKTDLLLKLVVFLFLCFNTSLSYSADSNYFYFFETSVKNSQAFSMSIGEGQFHINTKMGVIAGLCIVKGDTVRLVNGANEQLFVFDSNREILYDLDRHPIWVLKEMGYDKITLKKNNWQIIHDVGFVDQDGFINVMTKCVKYGFQYEFHHSGLIKKISKYAIDGILEFEIFFDEQSRFVELKEYK